jgi:hypothetical protein
MERGDWTPAVLITATVSLVTAGLVWLLTPLGAGRYANDAGPTIPLKRPPSQVVVWTGDVAPGLKGVLGPVWGDPKPDRDHDQILNGDLGLEGDAALSYHRLLVYNTTDETRSFEIVDGLILMQDGGGGGPRALKSLARMMDDGEITIPGGLAFSLRSLGALSRTVEIPAGSFAKLVVPFDRSASLESATAVVTVHGTDLKRRQMAAAAFRRLMEDPDESRLRDL